MDETRIGLIVMLLREGNSHDAIKAYQEEAGVSYLVARRRVGDLARSHQIGGHRLRVASLVLAALAGLLGLVLSY